MRRLWSWWVRMTSIRESGEVLALCRIMAGIGVVLSMAILLPDGAVAVLWADLADGGYRSLKAEAPLLVRLLGGPGPGVAWCLAIATLLGGLLLALGLFTRFATIVCVVLFNTVIQINFHDGSAYDSVLSNQLWLLMFARCGETWSLDCQRETGFWASEEKVPAWPRYVMVLQLALIYTSTGLAKLSAHWIPGGDLNAVWFILQDPFWQRFDFGAELAPFHWMTRLATAATWWFEVLAPLLLLAFYFRSTRDRRGHLFWLRRLFNWMDYRLWFALVGVGFHLGIWIFMRVGPFSWITLSFYPALWSSREIRCLLRRDSTSES